MTLMWYRLGFWKKCLLSSKGKSKNLVFLPWTRKRCACKRNQEGIFNNNVPEQAKPFICFWTGLRPGTSAFFIPQRKSIAQKPVCRSINPGKQRNRLPSAMSPALYDAVYNRLIGRSQPLSVHFMLIWPNYPTPLICFLYNLIYLYILNIHQYIHKSSDKIICFLFTFSRVKESKRRCPN